MRFFTGTFEIFLRAMPLPRYASNIIYPVIDQHLHIGNQLLVVFFFFMNYAHVYDIAGVSTPPGYFTKGGKMSVPVPPRFIRLSHLRIIKHSDPLRTDVLSLHIMSLGKGLCVMHC